MRGWKQGDMFLIKCFTETLVDETFFQFLGVRGVLVCKHYNKLHFCKFVKLCNMYTIKNCALPFFTILLP